MLELLAPTPAPDLSSDVAAKVARFASSDQPVVITGPIGVGKTYLARTLHDRSGRRGGFVAVPLTSLQQGFEHVTLAGHDKGAYTGAHQRRRGLLEEASGGTLFLDEIGDASVEGQRLLLELLTERGLRRLGEERRVRHDLRFILATHVDLDAAVAAGRFREDLLSRLGNCWIHLPALRERPAEIVPLLSYYLSRIVTDRALRPLRLSDELASALVAAPWTYNVRSLVSECQSLVTADPGDRVLRPEHLSERFWIEVRRFLAEMPDERPRIEYALTVTGGNRSRAIALLEMSPRTFHRRAAEGAAPRPRGRPRKGHLSKVGE